MSNSQQPRSSKAVLCGLALTACLGSVGCMAEYGGQNLPSPYYLNDDIQYFPPGPEFKLTREAAAQKEYRETQLERQGAKP